MRKRLLLSILMGSLFLNVCSIVIIQMHAESPASWPFPEIGPGIIQDSYHDQAPVLESPFGMIGDVPGGYSLYAGSPIQSFSDQNLSTMIGPYVSWALPAITLDIEIVLLAALVIIVPLAIVSVIGRRSYGTAKTR